MSNIIKRPAATQMDRIRAYYVEGEKLTRKTDQEKLIKLEAAHTFLLSGNSQNKTAKMIMKRYDMAKSMAYRIVKDAIDLFGSATKASTEGMRTLFTEYHMKIYKKCMKEKDYKNANKALELIAKLNGLHSHGNGEVSRDIRLPVQIEFTVDPAALSETRNVIEMEEGPDGGWTAQE